MLRLATGVLVRHGKICRNYYYYVQDALIRGHQGGKRSVKTKVVDGDAIFLEFDYMAKYMIDHVSSSPQHIQDFYHPRRQYFSMKTPEEVEDWVVEWESIKLAWDACAQMATDCDTLDIRTIAGIINRCKSGGYCNNSLLLDLVTKVLGDHVLSQFSLIQISMTVQSLGMLARDSRDEEEGERNVFKKYVVVNHAANDANGPTPEGAVDFFTNTCCKFTASLLGDFAQRNIIPGKCRIRELSTITHGLGLLFPHDVTLEEPPNDVEDWAAAMGQEFSKKAKYSDCLPIDFSNILHGLANLQCKKSVGGICWRLERSLGIRYYEQQAISNIVWALGKLNIGSQALFDLLGKHIIDTVSTFTPQGLSTTVYGLGLRERDGGISPERSVPRALADEIIKQRRIRAFTTQDFFSIVYGFGLLGFQDGDVVDALLAEINRRVGKRRERRERARQKQVRDEQATDGGVGESDSDEEDFEDEDVWAEHQMMIMQHALGRM